MNHRQLSPQEFNHLVAHGLSPLKADQYGTAPVEYITHHADFYNRSFYVDKRVLIPRIETEELVELTLMATRKLAAEGLSPINIFDIGCGSGCVGITVLLESAQEKIEVEMTLMDISPQALEVTDQNINRLVPNLLQSKIHTYKSDLLLDYPAHLAPHIIVANLPYIPSSQLPALPESVIDHEPKLALDGGKDGLEIIKQLLAQNQQLPHLPKHILLEVDESVVKYQIPEIEGYSRQLKKDQFKRPRFLWYSKV